MSPRRLVPQRSPKLGRSEADASSRLQNRCTTVGQWSQRDNTPFTQGLRPLCLHCATTKLDRSPLKAQRRQKGDLGRSGVAQRTFRPRHGRHGRREVLSMFKAVAQRSPRRPVACRSLKGGRRKARASPWSQNGCTWVGHWSTRKKMRTVVNILYQFIYIVYEFGRCFCLSCATIVAPLTDQ